MSNKMYAALIVALLALLVGTPAQADLTNAQSLYEQGRTREALAEVENLLANNPGDPELRFLRGIIYAEEGRNDDAIEVFAGLTQDYPDLPEPYNNLAVLFAEKGEFEKSRDALLAAIQTHPSYSTAHENLGDLYAKMAGMAYNRAMEEDRANESARVKLSAVNGLFTVPQRALATPAKPPAARPDPVTRPPVTEPKPTVVAAARPTPAPVRQPEPAAASTSRPPVTQPATSAPVASSGRNESAVLNVVEAWRDAWSSRNVNGYTGSYTADYSPTRSLSHSAWLQQRQQRLTAPSFISVDLQDIQVTFVNDREANVTFTQNYRSDSYQDRVRKTLNMTLTDDGWRIARERSEAL